MIEAAPRPRLQRRSCEFHSLIRKVEGPMSGTQEARGRCFPVTWPTAAAVGLLLLGFFPDSRGAEDEPRPDRWLAPQDWRRDSDKPALALGEKGKFDDQHIFAPHVIRQDGEFWVYYSGS